MKTFIASVLVFAACSLFGDSVVDDSVVDMSSGDCLMFLFFTILKTIQLMQDHVDSVYIGVN